MIPSPPDPFMSAMIESLVRAPRRYRGHMPLCSVHDGTGLTQPREKRYASVGLRFKTGNYLWFCDECAAAIVDKIRVYLPRDKEASS